MYSRRFTRRSDTPVLIENKRLSALKNAWKGLKRKRKRDNAFAAGKLLKTQRGMQRKRGKIALRDLHDDRFKAPCAHIGKEQGKRCAGDAFAALGRRNGNSIGKGRVAYAMHGDTARMTTVQENEKAQIICAFSKLLKLNVHLERTYALGRAAAGAKPLAMHSSAR